MAFATLPAPSTSGSPVPANERPNESRLPDPLLLPYLQASDAEAARAQLDRLIHLHADPIIASSISRFTRRLSAEGRPEKHNAEDVRGETVCQLLARVGAVRCDKAPPISDFRAYVKQTASYACWRQARKRRRETPLLLSSESFWESADGIGFKYANDTSLSVLQRELLRSLWEEILRLPELQRLALLLSCRDASGSSGVSLWLASGSAQPCDVAMALNIEESKVSALVQSLPLDDRCIAQQMGKKVQEIINLRFAARRGLLRRLSMWIAA